MSDQAAIEQLRKSFEANLLDGDPIQSGQMLAASEVWEWLEESLDAYVAEAIRMAIEIHDIEQAIERLDVQCSEGNCSVCDGRRPRLQELQSRLAQLTPRKEDHDQTIT